MNEYYVYAYLDPRKPGIFVYNNITLDHEPFYIGKGKNNRINYHLKCKGRNVHLNNKIKKILNLNLNPLLIKIYQNLNEDKSYEIEEELINIIGKIVSKTGPLVNIQKGGLGKVGFSEEAKEKIGLANTGRTISEEEREWRKKRYAGEGNPMYGKIHTKEAKRKISEAQKGTHESKYGKEKANVISEKLSQARKGKSFHSEKQIEILSNYMKNRMITDETKEKMSVCKSIKIECFENGNLFMIFKNLKDAGNYFKVSGEAINQAIKRCTKGSLYRKRFKLIQIRQ